MTPGYTTKAKFAADHLGCARSLVSKYAKAGRLVLDESGRYVHIEASLARIRETMGAPERSHLPKLAETTETQFADARERKEHYQAEIARLDYEERCGRLMEAERVVHAVSNAVVTLRIAIEETPAQIAPRLPIPRETQEQCRLLLAEHFEALLAQLASAFNQAAIGANA